MKRPKLKKSYRFAVNSSIPITLISTVLMGLFLYFYTDSSLWVLIPFAFLLFTTSFFILQYRAEKFIYKRIKKIFDEVSLLQSAPIKNEAITTDMATLNKQITKFARDKKLEIEALKIREDYRKEYIGNVSHELNTPLFMVQGYIHTLLDGAMKEKTLRKKYLQRAAKGVERLVFIVKDLEMISRLEAGDLNLDFTQFDIVEVVQSVFDLLEMRAAKRNISLSFYSSYEPIYVMADKERIQQVIVNLIMNSIKYGKNNGTTDVSIESITEQKILVRITDNGEGIAKENIGRLFERFYRVNKSGNRKEGGSGLGLSIVKHIMEAHGEKIYVESMLGLGSEFSFTLEKAL